MTIPSQQPAATGRDCKRCGGQFYRYSYGLQCHGCGYGPGGEVPGPKRKGRQKPTGSHQHLVLNTGRIAKRVEEKRRAQR